MASEAIKFINEADDVISCLPVITLAQHCKCKDDKFHRGICEPFYELSQRLKALSANVRTVIELNEMNDGFKKE